MKRHFDEELKELSKRLLRMSALVEEAIGCSIKALIERRVDLAREVTKYEEEVNALEIEIDELCLRLLALYQPEAVDLRFITSAMKINNNLERIADQAVNIAERSQEIIKQYLPQPLIDISRMAALVQKILRNSIDALVNRDEQLARDICRGDDEVDNLNDRIFRKLLTCMAQDPETVMGAMELILVGRHLERIADHATNIAEDVIYFTGGKTIKHHYEKS